MKNAFLILVLTFFSSGVFSKPCYFLSSGGLCSAVNSSFSYCEDYRFSPAVSVSSPACPVFIHLSPRSTLDGTFFVPSVSSVSVSSSLVYDSGVVSSLDSIFTFFILSSCFGFFISGWFVGGKH